MAVKATKNLGQLSQSTQHECAVVCTSGKHNWGHGALHAFDHAAWHTRGVCEAVGVVPDQEQGKGGIISAALIAVPAVTAVLLHCQRQADSKWFAPTRPTRWDTAV